MKLLLLVFTAILFVCVSDGVAQKQSSKMRVCGDPSAACTKRALFSDEDIPFEYPGNYAVAETAPFYVIMLQSVKLPAGADCEITPKDFDRGRIQPDLPKNKVFVVRGCYSIMNNLYTNVGENVIGLAVYAGATKAEADRLLKKVKTLGAVNGKDAYILRISTGFNGT